LSIPVSEVLSGLKLEGRSSTSSAVSEPPSEISARAPTKQKPSSPAKPPAQPQANADSTDNYSVPAGPAEASPVAGENERWSQLLSHLKKHEPRTAGLLKDALMMEFSPEKLVLSYPESYSFHIEKLREDKVQESLKKAILQLTSQEPEIVVITHEKTPSPLATSVEAPPKNLEKGRRIGGTSTTKNDVKEISPQDNSEVLPKEEASSEDIFGKSDDPLVQRELERFRAQIVKRKDKKEPEEK
jgi:hypothetical protein